MAMIRSGPETKRRVEPLDLRGQVELARYQLAWVRRRMGEDVPLQRVEVLLALFLHGCMPQGDICQHCQMSKAAIHRAIEQLSAKGVVLKSTCADDARRRQVQLSRQGKELVVAAFKDAMAYRDRLLERD